MAEDGSVLASAMATGGRGAIDGRTAGRCATIGKAGDIHRRADLRDCCDGMREAVGEFAADQPVEPARDCRRSDKTGPGAERLTALSRALFKKEADLKPHRIRYWLTPKPDAAFETKCADICAVYKDAAGADETHRTISIDEKTGIQALEPKYETKPARPGMPALREFEYIRHGTRCLIATLAVPTGQVIGRASCRERVYVLV